jgi:hypothetical protein
MIKTVIYLHIFGAIMQKKLLIHLSHYIVQNLDIIRKAHNKKYT